MVVLNLIEMQVDVLVVFDDVFFVDSIIFVLVVVVEFDNVFGVDDVLLILLFSCEVFVLVSVEVYVMVVLDVYVFCVIGEWFILYYNGMMFMQLIDIEGEVSLLVFVLVEMVVFIVVFDIGFVVVISLIVFDVVFYECVVLQFEGVGGLDLYVLENGVGYYLQGYVWFGELGQVFDLDLGNGVFIEFGDFMLISLWFVQVYIFLIGLKVNDWNVSLNVEVVIMFVNCGQDLVVQSLQIGEDGEFNVVDLVMMMLGCEVVGDLLIFGNMFVNIELVLVY